MRLFAISSLAALLLLGGCATSPKKQVASYLPHGQKASKMLEVEFIKQPQYLCGPTVLKMAAEKHLPGVDFEKYKEMTYREKAKGSLKSDMISATRRLGLTPYRVQNLDQMFQQIDDGYPVIIFQNLGVSWAAAWHYSLLIGYDTKDNLVWLHSDQIPKQSMGFERFMKTWERGDKWSYVVTPPHYIPATAGLEEALDNAVLFEAMGQSEISRTIYTAMIQKWPGRYEAHVGLSNLYYKNKKPKLAIQEALIAAQKNPNHPSLYYNLALMYLEIGQKKKALLMKDKSLKAAKLEELSSYTDKFASIPL